MHHASRAWRPLAGPWRSSATAFVPASVVISSNTYDQFGWKRQNSSLSPSGFSFTRLSRVWVPTGGIEASAEDEDDTHALLLRAGYLRQAHSGIFHMLPMGNRVQQKLERLVDKHMTSVGASKVALSSLSSEQLWQRSGRLAGHTPELFRLEDRKGAKFLLSPTHEEEITALIASVLKSPKDLPLRLYQISRKYRDEQRSRQGLLRGREFLMKDLYTFDINAEAARATYEEVRNAYQAFFQELRVPFTVAKADSGSMGGNLSHEYHFLSPKGEDTIIRCDTCDWTINEELDICFHDDSATGANQHSIEYTSSRCISKDRRQLVEVIYPKYAESQRAGEQKKNRVNVSAVRAALPDLELLTGIEDPTKFWLGGEDSVHLFLIDPRLPGKRFQSHQIGPEVQYRRPKLDGKSFLLTHRQPAGECPQCEDGHLEMHPAIEIGHTFYLGIRYSKPLNAVVKAGDRDITLEMGCHGIGISRMIAAVASALSDVKGLNWPAVIAPFSIVAMSSKDLRSEDDELLSKLQASLIKAGLSDKVDIAVDDRAKGMGWKLNDADLIGYPIILVMGRAYQQEQKVEVQCRRFKFKELVHVDALADVVAELLKAL